MSKAKPLSVEQREAAREAMLTGHSLSKISRCAGVVATIEYMLKDIHLLLLNGSMGVSGIAWATPFADWIAFVISAALVIPGLRRLNKETAKG